VLGANLNCEYGTINTAEVIAEISAWYETVIRVKMDNNRVISVAAIRKFVNGWTGSVTVENWNFAKLGISLTRE